MSQPTKEQRAAQKEEYREMITDEMYRLMHGEYTEGAIEAVIEALVNYEWTIADTVYESWIAESYQYGFEVERLRNGEFICTTDCLNCHHDFIQKIEPTPVHVHDEIVIKCTLPLHCPRCKKELERRAQNETIR